MHTRVAYRAGLTDDGWSDNSKTRVALLEEATPPEAFEELFTDNYGEIRRAAGVLARPAVAVVAVDAFRGTVAGSLCVAGKTGLANSAIVGRHSKADLTLKGDASLSLRHLAVIIEPLAVGSVDLRYRVMDLRTRTAFSDEHGRAVQGLVADGPLFVRCSGYVLFFVLTEQVARWPESARATWARLPARSYVAEREAEPGRDRARRASPGRRAREVTCEPTDHEAHAEITHVSAVEGPVHVTSSELLAPGERLLGALSVCSAAGAYSFMIGERAADHGVLLGRSSRCDGDHVLTSEKISRVHLLVIRVGERLYAIDTASSNGTTGELPGDGGDLRIASLESESQLHLARGRARVAWNPERR